jgi:hypothetical protein
MQPDESVASIWEVTQHWWLDFTSDFFRGFNEKTNRGICPATGRTYRCIDGPGGCWVQFEKGEATHA